jgi:hypothetical protein
MQCCPLVKRMSGTSWANPTVLPFSPSDHRTIGEICPSCKLSLADHSLETALVQIVCCVDRMNVSAISEWLRRATLLAPLNVQWPRPMEDMIYSIIIGYFTAKRMVIVPPLVLLYVQSDAAALGYCVWQNYRLVSRVILSQYGTTELKATPLPASRERGD